MNQPRKNRFGRWPTQAGNDDAGNAKNSLAEMYQRATDLMNDGNFGEAEALLIRVVEGEPENYYAAINLGYSQSALGKYPQATMTLEKAVVLQPEKAEPLYYLSRVHTTEYRYEQALALLEKAIEVQPSYLESFFERAYVLDLAGRPEDAVLGYSDYLARVPGDAVALMNRGRNHNMLGNYRQGIADLKEATVANPDLDGAWYLLGEGLAAERDYEDAKEAYQKCLDLNPGHARAMVGRGFCEAMAGNDDDAEMDYARALELEPELLSALQHRGYLRLNQRRYHEALADLEMALAQFPEDLNALYNSAKCLYYMGQYAQALDRWQKLERMTPADTGVLMGLADTYERMGNNKQMEAACTRAIEAGPTYMHPYTKRGYYRFSKGDIEGAKQDYETALALDPSWTITYNNYVVLLFAQKKYAEGFAVLERAQQVKPDMDYTCYNFACYYALHKQPALALEWLEKAFRVSSALQRDAMSDPDLASLREDPLFKRLLATNFEDVG